MLAILFRNCPHNGSATDGTNIRYALKCDTFTVQYTRQPLQIPMIGQSPEIFDLGIVRPSITLNGIVDTVGGASTTTANYQNMESMSIARKYWTGGSYQSVTQTYYIPYKNKLEQAVYDWTYKKSTPVAAIIFIILMTFKFKSMCNITIWISYYISSIRSHF